MQKTLNKFTTCLWFDSNAEEALRFYASLFENAKVNVAAHYGDAGYEHHQRPKGSVMTVVCTLDGQELMGLNGGPVYSMNPSISFYVSCKSEAEIDKLYKSLSDGGFVMMELMQYPFSKKYAWVNDRFGVSWQLNLTEQTSQKVSPCLMFTGAHKGQAEQAIQFYTSIFKNSSVDYLVKYEEGEQAPGMVKHAGFKLDGQQFIAMDSPVEHPFTFSAGTSFVVRCETQDEIDSMWEKLRAGSEVPGQCGWLTDKFGVAWQVVPAIIEQMMTDKDSAKRDRVMAAIMGMTKLDIAKMEKAYKGG